MKEAFYFPHFIGARNDRKIKRVRRDFGIEGYALYFMTLEVLREEQELSYPLSDVDILADDFGTSEAKLKTIILNYDLFSLREAGDGHMFFSPKQIEYLEPYFQKRETNRLKGVQSGAARRKKAEQLVLELSEAHSTEPRFNSSSTAVEQRKKERNKEEKEKIKKEFLRLKEISRLSTAERSKLKIEELDLEPFTRTMIRDQGFEDLLVSIEYHDRNDQNCLKNLEKYLEKEVENEN